MRTLVLAALCLAGCADTDTNPSTEPKPQVISAVGPTNAVIACNPAVGAGVCPFKLDISFLLPSDQFVQKVWVRFQTDGGDRGVDRPYLVPPTFGKADTPVPLHLTPTVPPTILGTSNTLTYVVRLETGAGAESAESTLTLSVQ